MSFNNRLDQRFRALKQQERSALVTFITSHDPDRETSQALLNGLPAAGADIIELGIPFSDPMADGPTIQRASNRALQAGATLKATLEMVATFRRQDTDTPIILMGYYNSILAYGEEAFSKDAAAIGVDGLIMVDLPPEEAGALIEHTRDKLHLIWLAAPTTPEERIHTLCRHAGGFLYYVSITGITGTASASSAQVAEKLSAIRKHSGIPVAVGFGIKTPEHVSEFKDLCDAVVVGSAIVDELSRNLDTNGKATNQLLPNVLQTVNALSQPLRK